MKADKSRERSQDTDAKVGILSPNDNNNISINPSRAFFPLNDFLRAEPKAATTTSDCKGDRDRATIATCIESQQNKVLEPAEVSQRPLEWSSSRARASQDGYDRTRAAVVPAAQQNYQDGTIGERIVREDISDNQNEIKKSFNKMTGCSSSSSSSSSSSLQETDMSSPSFTRPFSTSPSLSHKTFIVPSIPDLITSNTPSVNPTSPTSPACTLEPQFAKNQYLGPNAAPHTHHPSSSADTTLTRFSSRSFAGFPDAASTIFTDQDHDLSLSQGQEQKEPEKETPSHLPPMDKGWKAWLVVLASTLIQTFAFAPTEFIFGIFVQEYLHIYPTATPSSIALIGTIGSSTTYLVGFFSGAITDRWGYRLTSLVGTCIMTTALCLASFATKLWHLYLSQGILFGIGASLVYFSSIGAPTHWFEKRRGLAMGITASGSGLGGFFLAPLSQFLIDRFTIKWTLRVLGIYSFVICGGASLLLFERDKSDRKQRRIEGRQHRMLSGKRCILPAYIKELAFVTLVAFQFLLAMSYLTPIYFMELYSTHIGISKQLGAVINGWFNGASFFARIMLGLLADYVAPDVLLLVCSWSSTLAILILWTFSRSFPMYLFFAIVYGITFSGITTVTPVIVANQYGPGLVSGVLGIMYGFSCLALVAGSFISGYILEATKHLGYLPVIMYCGSMFAASALFATIWVLLLRRRATREIEMMHFNG